MKNRMPPLEHEDLAWLLHHVPVGILVQDAAGRVTWVNDTLETQLGMPAEDLLGKTAEELPLELTDTQAPEGTVYHLTSGLGGAEWLARDLQPLGEQPTQSVSFFLDITEAERARIQVDRLRQATLGQVSTDKETGLLSRKAVMAQLDAQVSRSRRYQNPLSVMLIRLSLREAEGEQSRSVVTFGRMLRDQTRWPDIIGRWDEQEFMLVLPETSAEAAKSLKDKILNGLAGSEASLTCSAGFGIAGWHKRDDPKVLVEKALHALNASTAAG